MIYLSWLLKFIAVLVGAACAMQVMKLLGGTYAIFLVWPKLETQDVGPEQFGAIFAEVFVIPLIGTLLSFFIARWIWRRGYNMGVDNTPPPKVK